MSFEARIFDDEDAPNGKQVKDLPDHFYSVAIAHAQRSRQRFPMLGRVDLLGETAFTPSDRDRLKSEWVMIESLAIGKQERDKWSIVFSALTKGDTFKGLQFIGQE